jgi:hypothetical protein
MFLQLQNNELVRQIAEAQSEKERLLAMKRVHAPSHEHSQDNNQ